MPVRPKLPGIESERIQTLRTVEDYAAHPRDGRGQKLKSAVVVGGGFIGVEMAENLRGLGMAVSLIEMQPQVLGQFDGDMASFLHAHMKARRRAAARPCGRGLCGYGKRRARFARRRRRARNRPRDSRDRRCAGQPPRPGRRAFARRARQHRRERPHADERPRYLRGRRRGRDRAPGHGPAHDGAARRPREQAGAHRGGQHRRSGKHLQGAPPAPRS